MHLLSRHDPPSSTFASYLLSLLAAEKMMIGSVPLCVVFGLVAVAMGLSFCTFDSIGERSYGKAVTCEAACLRGFVAASVICHLFRIGSNGGGHLSGNSHGYFEDELRWMVSDLCWSTRNTDGFIPFQVCLLKAGENLLHAWISKAFQCSFACSLSPACHFSFLLPLSLCCSACPFFCYESLFI